MLSRVNLIRQFVEVLDTPRTPIQVHEWLMKLYEAKVIWYNVYRVVKAHVNGCPLRCKHAYNHVIHVDNRSWVLKYLKELCNGGADIN